MHRTLARSGMLVGYESDASVLFTADLVSDSFPLIDLKNPDRLMIQL